MRQVQSDAFYLDSHIWLYYPSLACRPSFHGSARLALTATARAEIDPAARPIAVKSFQWTLPGFNTPLWNSLRMSKPRWAPGSQIVALDRDLLTERVGKLPRNEIILILAGIDTVLGR
jgi:hypothetical protein